VRDLTRQYRPKDWNSIIGQDALVKTLTNEIKTDSVGHAYLFCGPRGTGKTTTGRVFANCLDAVVIELDAASNNGVDSIRDLRNDVQFLPTDGKKYKVYIIDEVHMLTTGAFNAFLKTLEEPPAHVIFILATTDPQKLPTTILSRCQRFDLRRITVDEIVKRLAYICEQEAIKLDPDHASDVLEYIARQVDGGMRDAIKLLQKCTSLDEIITVQTVVDALGSVNEVHLKSMTDYLLNRDMKNMVTYFNQLVSDGIDVKVFLADMIEYIKDSMTDDIMKNQFNIDKRMELTDGIIALLANLRNATQVKTLTELSLIKLCRVVKNEVQMGRERPAPEIENTPATEERKEVNTIIQSLPVDGDALQQVTEKLTKLEKRMMVNEMAMDTLRFQKR
jgi:DNA polymerase-3 subunit gamma/tau